MKGKKKGVLGRKKRDPRHTSWTVGVCWSEPLALWIQDEGGENQVDMGGRCQSSGLAGTPLDGMRQAKQPLVGRSDPGY